MKHHFSVIIYSVGALLLLGGAFGVYRSHVSATNGGGYQASALDSFVSGESPTPVAFEYSEVADSPTSSQSPIGYSEPLPLVVITPATVPSQSPIFDSPVQTPSVVSVASIPLSLTSGVGFGGTLTNRVVPTVVAPEVASPAAPSSSLEIATAATSTVIIVPIIATSTPAAATTTDVFVCTPDASSTLSAVLPANHVVISQLFIDMVGADTQEFVELYNPTDQVISLASSSLQYLSSTATSAAGIVKKNFAAGVGIASHGFYLIGMGGYTGSTTADMLWSQSLGNEGGSVLLVASHDSVSSSDNPDVIERIAYGNGALLLGEGSPAPLPPIGSSLLRTQSSGSNVSDFSAQSAPTPRNSSATTQ